MARSHRSLWLGVVALALVTLTVLWLRTGASTVAGSAPRTPARPSKAAGASEDAPMAPTAVRLDALEADRQAPGETARNPFRFGAGRAPTAPPLQAVAGPEPGPPVPLPPPGPPPPPPITLKFIGTVEKAGGFKVAVLTGGSYPLYGREGEIVDGRYRILKIGEESLEIAYLDGRGPVTLRLTGQ